MSDPTQNTPAVGSTDPTAHPEWCARPADEPEQGIHLGQVLDANPAPDSLLGIAVQLYQHHPMPEHPGPFPTGVALLITEDSTTQWYPLPQGQAVALLHRLRWALRRAGAVK